MAEADEGGGGDEGEAEGGGYLPPPSPGPPPSLPRSPQPPAMARQGSFPPSMPSATPPPAIEADKLYHPVNAESDDACSKALQKVRCQVPSGRGGALLRVD